MLNSGFVGVAIGLILVYFLLSLLISGINEIIEAFWHRRARYLEVGIWDLLGPLTKRFYDHHIIEALKPPRGRPPRVEGVREDTAVTQKSHLVAGKLDANQTLPQALAAGQVERERFNKNNPAYIPARAFSRTVQDLLIVEQMVSTTLATTPIAPDASGSIDISVASAVGFPSEAGFYVRIDGEVFHVTAVNPPGSAWTVQRADPAAADEHAVGAPVTLVPTTAPDTHALFARLESAVAIGDLPDSLRKPLQTFLANADRDIDRWRTQVEQWFDDKMDRLSGWYKRRTKWILFAIGLVLVASLNADTVMFARTLWSDATLRGSITAQAQKFATTAPDCTNDPEAKDNPAACAAKLLKDVKDLNLPLGWTGDHKDPRYPNGGWGWPLKFLGILLTALALSLGAPFWFDLLNKVTNFRASGVPPPTPEPAAAAAPAKP